LADLAQAAARRDPHQLQGTGGAVVADRLRTFAVDADERAVDRTDDVGDSDVRGFAGEPPPAGLTTLALHDTRAPQVGEDRLEEAVRDLLQTAELLGAHRIAVGPHGELDE